MAHAEKIKIGDVTGLLVHDLRYEGDGIAHENGKSEIDLSRTGLNRLLCFGANASGDVMVQSLPATEGYCTKLRLRAANRLEDVKASTIKQNNGRKIRKDAVGAISFVVTLPFDWPEDRDEGEFFSACYWWFGEKFGRDNVSVAAIHYDETTPHMHVMVIPEKEGKLQANKLLTRSFLRNMHPDLQARVESVTGVKCSVLLPEDEQLKRTLSKLDQDDMKVVNGWIKQQVAEQREELDHERKEVERSRRVDILEVVKLVPRAVCKLNGWLDDSMSGDLDNDWFIALWNQRVRNHEGELADILRDGLADGGIELSRGARFDEVFDGLLEWQAKSMPGLTKATDELPY